MPTRLALCISLTIALLAAPASALAADVVVPSSVEASATVPAGGLRTLTLRCPAASVALNAAVSGRDAAVTVRRSIPGRQANEWKFLLSAPAGASNRGVRAVLRCVRLELPDGVSPTRLVVSTKRPPNTIIPAGSSTPVEVSCRPGFVATGYGLDRGGRRDVTIAAAVPHAGGWSFRLENSGATPASAELSVRCLRRSVSARRAGAPTTLSFRFARRAFSNTVFRNSPPFFHSCRPGQFSVATGSEVDAAARIELRGSYPSSPRGGAWNFAHGGGGEEVQSFLVCLSRRSRFG
jgi:hypothetical protein